MSAAAPRASSQLSAIILAAGASTRMGHPKALLDLGGETALAILVSTFRKVGIADIVAVIPPDEAIAAEAERRGARVVRNPLAHLGRTGSLQFGWRETDVAHDIVFISVDCPLVGAGVVARILAAGPGHDIVRPTHGGRGGHPVFLASRLRSEVLALAPDSSLRTVIHRDPARRLDLPVDSAEVLANLNTPDDYEAARARRASAGD